MDTFDVSSIYNDIEESFEFLAPAKEILKTNKIGLIDADFLKYLVVSDMAKMLEKKEIHLYKDPVLEFTKQRVANITNRFEAKGLIFLFSGPSQNTFRAHMAFEKKYKGARNYVESYEGENADKMKVVAFITERYPSLLFPDLEADDLISMLQDEDTFIVAKDKDSKQITGTHYDLKKECFYEISQADAFSFLMRQMLEGDSVDNISGLVGCGSIGTDKLLTNVHPSNMHKIVMKAYCEKYGLFNGIDAFVESWNLLRMRNKRGEYFLSKYKRAFDLLTMIKNQ